MLKAGVTELTAYAASAGVPDTATALLSRSIEATEAWITDAIGQLVGPIAEAVTVLILGGFLTFYVIQDGHKAWAMAIRDLDDWRQETLTARGAVALERVGEYLRGTALNAGVGALTTWLYLQVLGVPLAGPIAVFVFLAGFMPYIGPVVSTAFVLLVTLAARDLVATVILLALIVVTSLFQRRVFSRYVRQTMPTQPALIVIALPAGAALFGLIGLIAAVPAVIVAETFAPAIVATLESGRREVAAAGALVPVWLDRLAQWAWRALVIGGVGAIVVGAALQFPGVTLPLVLALVLAATLKLRCPTAACPRPGTIPVCARDHRGHCHDRPRRDGRCRHRHRRIDHRHHGPCGGGRAARERWRSARGLRPLGRFRAGKRRDRDTRLASSGYRSRSCWRGS